MRILAAVLDDLHSHLDADFETTRTHFESTLRLLGDTVITVPRLLVVSDWIRLRIFSLSRIMEIDYPSDTRDDVTTEFEQQLADVVLTAFGRGGEIEGTWDVTTPVSAAPNWSVTIVKHVTDDPSYEPEFIEE